MAKKSDKTKSVRKKVDATASVKHYIAIVHKQADEDMKRHVYVLMKRIDERFAGVLDRKTNRRPKKWGPSGYSSKLLKLIGGVTPDVVRKESECGAG